MSKNLKSCFEKLKFISSIKNTSLQKKLLAQVSDNCMYQALHEIAVNTIKGKVNLNSNQKRNLRKHKKHIKALSRKTKDYKKKKRLIIQSGGFLSLIIPAIAALLPLLTN